MVNRKCEICSKILTYQKSTCSRKCKHDLQLRQIIVLRQKEIDQYSLDPKLCFRCKNKLKWEKRFNKFCSHSCSAIANNWGTARGPHPAPKECKRCGKIFAKRKVKIFCSQECKDQYYEERDSLDKVLIENSSYNRGFVKEKLISKGLLQKRCYKCGLGEEWNNEPLTLQIDHINGVSNDNRLENLRILCPNCHSQTPTHAWKNLKNKNRLKFLKNENGSYRHQS